MKEFDSFAVSRIHVNMRGTNTHNTIGDSLNITKQYNAVVIIAFQKSFTIEVHPTDTLEAAVQRYAEAYKRHYLYQTNGG